MLEIIVKNIELVQSVLTTLSIGPFIMVITSLLKDQKYSPYTPYIAVIIGIITGLTASLAFAGFSAISILVGIIFGTLAGAEAVGIKVLADGAKKKDAKVSNLIKTLEAMKM